MNATPSAKFDRAIDALSDAFNDTLIASEGYSSAFIRLMNTLTMYQAAMISGTGADVDVVVEYIATCVGDQVRHAAYLASLGGRA